MREYKSLDEENRALKNMRKKMGINLLKETLRYLHNEIDKDVKDVKIVATKEGETCSWGKFCAMADKEYFNTYGVEKVRADLMIVFNDGLVMYRHIYDGTEEWRHIPVIKSIGKEIERLFNES